MFSTYVLESEKTENYYIGSCEDLFARIARHNSGRNRSTQAGIPWKLVYSESFMTRQEAYRREFQIKNYKGGEAFKKLLLSQEGSIRRRG